VNGRSERRASPGGHGAPPSVSAKRRWLLWGVAALAASLVAISAASQDRPRLIVYLQTQVRARALEAMLARQMPMVDVIVCGRYRDFTKELATSPEAALSLPTVLRAHGLTLDLKAVRAGQESEAYVLLSIGKPVDKEHFPALVVGAVDLLGRDGTADFVATLLGLESPPPEIKYVIKSEDLLPLLQFQSAEAVVLPEQEAARIKSLSKLDLKVTPLPTRVGLPAVSFRSEASKRLIGPLIIALDAETQSKLGVDAWH